MTEIRVSCRVRIRDRLEDFLGFVARLQAAVREEGSDGTTIYDYYLDQGPGDRRCYIHEGYRDVASFVRHMDHIRPLLGGMEDLIEVEALDVSGPLTPDLMHRFSTLYGPRFRLFPDKVKSDW
jgi:quinol monooxygenase YgiN